MEIISLQARAARGVHHIHKNEMILQADKNAIIAATLVCNEIKTGLEKANNLLFYRFFHICQAEIFACAVLIVRLREESSDVTK